MKKAVSTILLVLLLLLTGCSDGSKEGAVSKESQKQQGKAEETEESAGQQKETERSQGDEDVKSVIPKETVTLDVYSQLTDFQGEQSGWFAQILLEKFNVKLNFIYDGTENFYERKAQEGDLGDIVIFGTDTDQYHDAIDKGLLLDWDAEGRLAAYGSYMAEHMVKALEKNRKNSGGHLYGFGYDVSAESGAYGDFDYHPDVRWDLYEQIGSPRVVELEDYVEVLKQMKELCPLSDSGEETYGVSLFNDWDGDMMMFAKSTCTNFFGVDELGIGLYDAADGSFQGCLAADGYYLRVLKFYNELYRNQLLDPDSIDQGYEGCLEDYRDGRAFFCIFGWLAAPQYNTVNHTADGKIMLPLAAENQNTLVYGLNENGGNRLWTIGSKTEYPELTMAILNWLCTPEGRLTMEYGPKGVCWDYDMEGNTCIIDFGYKVKNGEQMSMPESSGYEGSWQEGCPQFNNTTWTINTSNPSSNGQTYNYQYWPNVLRMRVSEAEEQWREKNQVSSVREYLSGFNYTVSKPNSYTASSKSEELGEKWAKVTEIIRTGSWNSIYADTEEEFAEQVSRMQADAAANGYEDCVKWCEEEAQRRKASEE